MEMEQPGLFFESNNAYPWPDPDKQGHYANIRWPGLQDVCYGTPRDNNVFQCASQFARKVLRER